MSKAKKKNILFGNTHPAVIAIWAGLIGAANLLPSIPMTGTGGTMTVATLLLPIAGIFFGAIPGALAASIGRFIGQLIAPSTAIFGIFSFVIGTVAGLVAGLFWEGKWWQSALISLLLTVLWFTNKIGRSAYMMAVIFNGSGFITAVFSGTIGKKWIKGDNPLLRTIAFYVMCYSAMVISTTLANYLMLYIYQTPVITWKIIMVTAPIERLIFAAGSTVIGIPLLIGLPKIGITVGPKATHEMLTDKEELDDNEEM